MAATLSNLLLILAQPTSAMTSMSQPGSPLFAGTDSAGEAIAAALRLGDAGTFDCALFEKPSLRTE